MPPTMRSPDAALIPPPVGFLTAPLLIGRSGNATSLSYAQTDASLKMIRVYTRRADAFAQHPGEGLLQ